MRAYSNYSWKDLLDVAAKLYICLCIGMGAFYITAKFHVPWYGGDDFIEYSKMVESPFHNDAKSPFAYRPVVTTLAHFIKKTGLYYKTDTPFRDAFTNYNNKKYDPNTLLSLIFTNYLFLIFGCYLASLACAASIRKESVNEIKNSQELMILFL